MRSEAEIRQALSTVEKADDQAPDLAVPTRNTIIDVLRWVLGMSSYFDKLLMMLSVSKGRPS